MDNLNAALKYRDYGLSVIPTKEDKTPAVYWKTYSQKSPSEVEIKSFFTSADKSIAIICGKVSQGVEVLDFDNHLGDAQTIFDHWSELVKGTVPGIYESLVIETTQSGGFHVFYRCSSEIPGNQKLARRTFDGNKKDTFIETRGEGGYVIVAPSKGYKLIQNDFNNLPIIDEYEREALIAIARSFDIPDTENQSITPIDSPEISERPGDVFNQRGDIKDLLVEYGWTFAYANGPTQYWRRPGKDKGVSATFNHLPNKFYVFSSNSAPFENGVSYSKFKVYSLLKHQGDDKTATKDLAKKGFGKLITKKEKAVASKAPGRVVSYDEFKEKSNKNNDETKEFDPETLKIPASIVFWYEHTNSRGEVLLKLKKSKLIAFWEYYGFRKYWIDSNQSAFIRIVDNIVSSETPETMIDFLKCQVLDLPWQISETKYRSDLWEVVLQGIKSLRGSELIATLAVSDKPFVRDSKHNAFVFFKNGCVKISAGSDFELLPYSAIQGLVWKEQIVNHDIEILPKEQYGDLGKSMFGRFLQCVCSPLNKEKNEREIDHDRLFSLMSAIGYLLHTYKDSTITKAIIFCEERIAESDESNGRTGKGVTYKAISLLRKTLLFNGKQVDFTDRFVYQKVTPDTQVMVFDDVQKRFNFEALFSILTEGMSVERKGQKPFDIPFSESAKILINTNYVVSNDSDSHKARKFEIEFSDYFSAAYTPVDELGGYMFHEGWDVDNPEWNRFYNTMFACIQWYIGNGLVTYKQVNLEERKLRATIPEEFLDFIPQVADQLKNEGQIIKSNIYNAFVEANPIFGPRGKRAQTANTIGKWTRTYLKKEKIDYIEKNIRTELGIFKGYELKNFE